MLFLFYLILANLCLITNSFFAKPRYIESDNESVASFDIEEEEDAYYDNDPPYQQKNIQPYPAYYSAPQYYIPKTKKTPRYEEDYYEEEVDPETLPILKPDKRPEKQEAPKEGFFKRNKKKLIAAAATGATLAGAAVAGVLLKDKIKGINKDSFENIFSKKPSTPQIGEVTTPTEPTPSTPPQPPAQELSEAEKTILANKIAAVKTMLQNAQSKLSNLKEKKAEELILSKVQTSLDLISNYFKEVNLAKNANEATAIAKKADLEYANILQLESTIISPTDPVIVAKIKAADTMKAESLATLTSITAKTNDQKYITEANNIMAQINDLWNKIQVAYNVNQATDYARKISSLKDQLSKILTNLPATKIQKLIDDLNKNIEIRKREDSLTPYMFAQIKTSMDKITNYLEEIKKAQNDNDIQVLLDKVQTENAAILNFTNLSKESIADIMLDISFVNAIVSRTKQFISTLEQKAAPRETLTSINLSLEKMQKYLKQITISSSAEDSKNIANNANSEYLTATDIYLIFMRTNP